MAFLYINPKGQPWRSHSYSAGNTFEQCELKYYLRYVEGWKEKDNKGAFMFGRALENAIQWHHEHEGQGAVENFIAAWQVHASNKDIQYTRTEKDWASLLRAGIEMLKLYIIKQPQLPIPIGGATLFQKEVGREVFPGDPNYGEIEDKGKLDIIAYVDPNHPMLPKLVWKPEYGPLRPLIVDIKTTAVEFPDQYGMAAYDVQLRRYSWHSGIRDVALLSFIKKAHSMQKGSRVSLLEHAGPNMLAGSEAIIAKVDGETIWLVANESMIEQLEKAQGKNERGTTDTTKAAKERAETWILEFGVPVKEGMITKQRLQFNAGYVSERSAEDAGDIARRQIVNIVNCWNRHKQTGHGYANTFGIRFPHNDINDPYFTAFVLGDEKYRDLMFKRVEEESMDELFGDREEPDV